MPFPTVNGHEFVSNLTTLWTEVLKALKAALPEADLEKVEQAGTELFQAADAVSTQLYYDEQRLKREAKAHGWNVEDNDPSQAPE